MAGLSYQFLSSVHQLPAERWNRLAATDSPFVRHEWMAALEDSDATSATTGWQPQHLLVQQSGEDRLLIPGFLKSHSYGEYVFDWAWADAYQRYGEAYYPKLVSAVPFTPCYGPRLLGNWQDPELVRFALGSIQQSCHAKGWSGWHCLFPTPEQSQCLDEQGVAVRTGTQFHWFNRGFSSFEEFVGTFSSRKRKNLLKERRRLMEQGFTFEVVTGAALSDEHWDFFYPLYQHTYLKRSGHGGYLGRSFFRQLGATLAEHCVLIVAEKGGERVAASLLLQDADTLYGRYWGCRAEFDFLHFETCYYQGIDYAIKHNLQRFDGGAQGEHKLARGFEPVLTYSHHYLSDTRFQQAVNDFLQQEAVMVGEYFKDAEAHLPFRHDESA